MKPYRSPFSIAIVTIGLLGGGIAQGQETQIRGAVPRQPGEIRQTDDGARQDLAQAVRARLAALEGVDASQLTVEVDRGTVTLTGKVSSLPENDRITEAVSSVSGVENVIVSLDVQPAPRPDQEIRADIRRSIGSDPAALNFNPQISVNKGVVTLTGEVRSWAEKRLAGWLASEVRGVREVRNQLDVPTAGRTDEELRRAIEMRFAADPRINDRITVRVRDGNVALSGIVRTFMEKQWAEIDARGAGASEVDVTGLRVRPVVSVSDRVGWDMTDEDIREAVTSAYRTDPRVASFNPRVEVRNGVVTLTGTVTSMKAKRAAVQHAENTRGVTAVNDQLVVRAENRADAEIARDLRESLERNASVNSAQIDIRIEGGRAVLSGTVDSNFEKWSAEDIASRAAGVIAVDNELRIDSPGVAAVSEYYYYPWHSSYVPWTLSARDERKTDAELREDVRNQLTWSPFTDAEDIRVEVAQGVVTLTGEVDNRMERSAAADNAYQAGARRVENRLTVLQPTGR